MAASGGPDEAPRARSRVPFIRRIGFLPYAVAGVLLALLRPGGAPVWADWALYLAAGVLAGIVLLPIAAIVVGMPAASALRGLAAAPRRLLSLPHGWLLVAHYALVAVSEELFYRVGLQASLLGGGIVAILGVAALFTALHQIGRREIVIVNVLELFAFACLLGLAYDTTRSLVLIATAHAVRDIGVVLMGERRS